MVAAAPVHFPPFPPPVPPPGPTAGADPAADQRIILHGVSWERYEALLAVLGDDAPGVRVTYLEGELELMSPSRSHEAIKKMFARLIETFARAMDIELEATARPPSASAPGSGGPSPTSATRSA